MESNILITIDLLLTHGFDKVIIKNINDESDSREFVLYQKGDIAVGYDYGWGVYEMGHDKPLFKYSIQTWEDLINGMNTRGLAMVMPKK